MACLLHIDSSPMGTLSVSRELSQFYVDCWTNSNSSGTVLRRDLTSTALAPVTGPWITASYSPVNQRTNEQVEILSLSNLLIAELRQADEYVIAFPFHNFNIPSSLKLWLDLLYRVGETFDYIDGKPTGLLPGKKATFIMASGGLYTEGSRLAPLNHATPYLKTIMSIFGVTDVTFLLAGGTKQLRSGEIARDVFMRPHLDTVQAHVGSNA
jgi:FMN-dependent NADH-azoreductase